MKRVKHLFKDEVSKKILLFFNENPNSIDTAKGISAWIGCDFDTVQKMLNKLVKEGVLLNHKTASTNAYSYTTQRDVVKTIERYIKNHGHKATR